MLHRSRPNILVLSAGGFGHVPIPLVKGEITYRLPKSVRDFQWDIGFVGNNRPLLSRHLILAEMRQLVDKVFNKIVIIIIVFVVIYLNFTILILLL